MIKHAYSKTGTHQNCFIDFDFTLVPNIIYIELECRIQVEISLESDLSEGQNISTVSNNIRYLFDRIKLIVVL